MCCLYDSSASELCYWRTDHVQLCFRPSAIMYVNIVKHQSISSYIDIYDGEVGSPSLWQLMSHLSGITVPLILSMYCLPQEGPRLVSDIEISSSVFTDRIFPIKKPMELIFSLYLGISRFNTDTDVSSSVLFFVSMMKKYTKMVSTASHAT